MFATAVVAGGALLLAGCSGGTGEADSGPVTITYSVWAGTQTPAMQEIIDAFEEENPDINVDLLELPWPQYWSTLQTGAQGGTAPDAFWMLAQQIRPYASGNQLLDLTDAIEAEGVDLSKYPQAVLDLYDQGDGKIYGLPKDFDTNGVYYNKALFDAAGVDYPSDGLDLGRLPGDRGRAHEGWRLGRCSAARLLGRVLQLHLPGRRSGDLG